MHDLFTGMAEPLPGNASGPGHWHWPLVPSPPPGYCWDQSEPPPTIPENDTPQTHIYTNTQGKDNRNTHTGMNRGKTDNTQLWQGDTDRHKQMCTRRKWAHRKEIEDRQTNPKRFKSSPGIMRKVAQREMQIDETTQNQMKHR